MSIGALTLIKSTGTDAGTDTDITGKVIALFNTDSSGTDNETYPMSVPSEDGDPTVYSYESWLKWKLTIRPDNYIQNISVYGSNAQPADNVTVYMGITSTGVTPVNTQSSIATTRQDTNYTSAGTSLTLAVQPGDGKLDQEDDETYWLVMQLAVDFGAPQGSISMSFNVTYDEV